MPGFLRLTSLLLLLMLIAACSTGTQETTETLPEESEAMHEDEHEESEEHDDEHGHEAEEDPDHEDGDSFRDHGAHEHGAAALMIAWSGDEVAIDLQTPAFNVLGFEYAPASAAEQALLEESVAALEAGDLFQLTPAAECTLTSASVHTELADEAHGHEEEEGEHDDEDEEHDDEDTHSDIDVSYNFHCLHPERIESLDATALFAQFPNFEDLRAAWISDTQQSAKDLTANDPVLPLR
jgi:hypothetical protein